jgi:hypothetical protein
MNNEINLCLKGSKALKITEINKINKYDMRVYELWLLTLKNIINELFNNINVLIDINNLTLIINKLSEQFTNDIVCNNMQLYFLLNFKYQYTEAIINYQIIRTKTTINNINNVTYNYYNAVIIGKNNIVNYFLLNLKNTNDVQYKFLLEHFGDIEDDIMNLFLVN